MEDVDSIPRVQHKSIRAEVRNPQKGKLCAIGIWSHYGGNEYFYSFGLEDVFGVMEFSKGWFAGHLLMRKNTVNIWKYKLKALVRGLTLW